MCYMDKDLNFLTSTTNPVATALGTDLTFPTHPPDTLASLWLLM
jgi:hypothetical protein